MEERATLIGSLIPFTRPRRSQLWALRDVDLAVAPGESVAVIGRNGAGKTTLLRVLAGVTSPTVGRARLVGRIAPLISLGVGFDQEMSGRENVMVNGMLLGLTARQVAQRFDSIVDFAELRDFIDTPVKFYSSGMMMRLGFAVIAHVEPTILLLDEILAVGDAGFQLKCFERLRRFRDDGAASLVVTHSLPTVRQLCQRAVLMQAGRVVYDGDVETAIMMHLESDPGSDGELPQGPRIELLEPRLTGGTDDGRRAAYGDRMQLLLRLRFHDTVHDPQIAFGSATADGLFGGVAATEPGRRWRTFQPGDEAELRIAFLARMGAGTYRLAVDVKDRDGGRVLARSDHILLTVAGRPGTSGLADVGARIELARL